MALVGHEEISKVTTDIYCLSSLLNKQTNEPIIKCNIITKMLLKFMSHPKTSVQFLAMAKLIRIKLCTPCLLHVQLSYTYYFNLLSFSIAATPFLSAISKIICLIPQRKSHAKHQNCSELENKCKVLANGLASRRKSAHVFDLAFHLRVVWTPTCVEASFSPFGHPMQVDTS